MVANKKQTKKSKKTTPKKAKRTAAKRVTMTKAQRDQLASAVTPLKMQKTGEMDFKGVEMLVAEALTRLEELSALLIKATAKISEDDVVDNTWDEKLAKAQDYYDGTKCAEEAEELGLARIGYQFVAFKYMYRAGRKQGESAEADLASAEWYLTRALEKYPELADDERFLKLVQQLEQLKEVHQLQFLAEVD